MMLSYCSSSADNAKYHRNQCNDEQDVNDAACLKSEESDRPSDDQDNGNEVK